MCLNICSTLNIFLFFSFEPFYQTIQCTYTSIINTCKTGLHISSNFPESFQNCMPVENNLQISF